MSDIDVMFGLSATPDEPDPCPAPASTARPARGQRATPEPASETVDPVAAREAAADAKAQQDRILAAEAVELAELAERVARAGAVQGPQVAAEAVRRSPQEFVIDRWMRYGQGDAIVRLGLPAGSRLRATSYGSTGVRVQVKVPSGTALPAAAGVVTRTAERWEWGGYTVEYHDATSFTLTREIVGADPATPWRAAGRTAYAVYADDPRHVRAKLWEAAGLTIKRPDGRVLRPRIVDTAVGARGPEILIDLPAGLSVDAAVKVAPVMQRLLRCPDLAMVPEGVRVRIELRTVPAAGLPPSLLRPAELWLARTPEQAIQVAGRIALPVGIAADGDGGVERVHIDLASRPMGIVVGQPGSGKTRWLRTAVSAFALQGGQVLICDAKGGEMVTSNLPGVVHVSVTPATIARTLWWGYQELLRRLALVPKLTKLGVTAPPFPAVWILVDEWGQMFTELIGSADTAEQKAASEMVRLMTKLFQVGRSVRVYCTCISHTALADAMPGALTQSAGWRLIAGKPQGGAAGSGTIERLFPKSMQEAAHAAAEGIVQGSKGAVLLDFQGRPVAAQAAYGYTPGEEPDAEEFQDLPAEIRQSWVETREALRFIPQTIRFGWRPTAGMPEDWQALSLYAGKNGDEPTVRQLEAVPLDRFDHTTGQVTPIPANARFDPLSGEYEGGSVPLDLDRHYTPQSY